MLLINRGLGLGLVFEQNKRNLNPFLFLVTMRPLRLNFRRPVSTQTREATTCNNNADAYMS